MKFVLSISKEILQEADRLARRTKHSRNRLFNDALKEYLAPWTPDKITQAMNDVLVEIGDEKNEFAASTSKRILQRSEW